VDLKAGVRGGRVVVRIIRTVRIRAGHGPLNLE
jgi:hypothetical protein